MFSDVFGADGVLVLLAIILPIAVALWALIDALVRPAWAFRAARQYKALWVILPIVGLWLAFIPGGILGVVYLVAIRPKVRRATVDDGDADSQWDIGRDRDAEGSSPANRNT